MVVLALYPNTTEVLKAQVCSSVNISVNTHSAKFLLKLALRRLDLGENRQFSAMWFRKPACYARTVRICNGFSKD